MFPSSFFMSEMYNIQKWIKEHLDVIEAELAE